MQASVILLRWLLLRLAASLSMNILNPSKPIPDLVCVEWLDIYEPLSSGSWQLTLKVDDLIYRLILEETWRTNSSKFTAMAATGVTYSLQDQAWVEQGYARMVIMKKLDTDETPQIQGSFVARSDLWHLIAPGPVNYDKALIDKALIKRPIYESVWKWLMASPLFRYEGKSRKKQYHIWKESALDLVSENSCGSRTLIRRDSDSSSTPETDWPNYADLQRSVGVTDGCFQNHDIAPIGIAADSNYLMAFNSFEEAYLNIIDTVNKASQVWEAAFNISLSISEIIFAHDGLEFPWDQPCNSSDDSMTALANRLQSLSDWRKTDKDNDGLVLWSLFTNCPSSDVVGLAWQASACTSRGANVIHHSILDYRVLAHEIGHVFGAVHDCTNTTCGDHTICCPYSNNKCDASGRYIMNPGSSADQYLFSPCTQGNVCSGITSKNVDVSCLVPKVSTPQLQNLQCSNITSNRDNEICWRNMQCRDYMNSSGCGNLNSCSLQCFNHETNQCRDLRIPLLDGTPCGGSTDGGKCMAGKCVTDDGSSGRKATTRMWVLISIFVTLGVGVFICLLTCIVVRWRKKPLLSKSPKKMPKRERLIRSRHVLNHVVPPMRSPFHSNVEPDIRTLSDNGDDIK